MAKRTRKRVPDTRPNNEDHPLLHEFAAVQEAEKLRLAGKFDQARSTCAAVLTKDSDYVAALFTMGLILADQSQYDKALSHLHRATMLNPFDHQILTGLSGVYLRLGANLMAARTLEQALHVAPKDTNILITLGEIYREEKEYELSKEAFEAVLDIEPTLLVAEIGLARNLIHIGELAEAAKIFERQVRGGSRLLSYLYYLSQLPASLVNLDLISLLKEAKPQGKKAVDDQFRAQLAFTKAAALDKAGRYEEAWTQVGEARGYYLVENRTAYDKLRQKLAPLLALARKSRITTPSTVIGQSEHPISLFITGPSRSGKTSLERLVGLLAGVKRGYENPIVENAVRRTFQTAGFPTRSHLVQLPPGLSEMFRKFYCEELRKRAGSAKVLTNTLPTRTQDAMRAASEIPNARFVFFKRNIDDLTIRIFMRNYAHGNYYASDLSDIRDYLQWCHKMIDVMAAKMPDISKVVTYEEMVADPASVLVEVAELCGLDMPGDTLPDIGDDRECAAPYRDLIEAAVT